MKVPQDKLAALRRYRNIPQRELADELKITLRAYANKEKGITQFTASEMFIIAKKFNMKIEDIFLPPDFMNHEVSEVN